MSLKNSFKMRGVSEVCGMGTGEIFKVDGLLVHVGACSMLSDLCQRTPLGYQRW